LSCPSTLGQLCHLSSGALTAFFLAIGHMECLLALIVLQALNFLSSNVWANLILL
jgi:hypothetical protein